MSTIIFKCLDTPSHYNATYKLAQKLKDRKHRVIYIGLECFRDTITRQGFEFYSHDIFPHTEKAPESNMIKQIIHRYKSIKKNEKYYLKGLPLEEVITKFKPDLFILDVSLNFLFPILLEKKIKYIIYNTKVNLNKSDNIPPVTSSFIPKDNLWSKIRVALDWQSCFFKRWVFRTHSRMIHFGVSKLILIKKYLKKNHVDPHKIIDTNRVGQIGIRTAPEIIFSLQEFDFGHSIGSNQLYMSPCVNLSRDESAFNFNLFETLKSNQTENAFDKVVYCSFGSYDTKYRLTRIQFLVNLLNVFLNKKNYLLIVATGNDISPHWFKFEAPNIHLYQKVPQLEILSKCDLMIHQGGMQSVQECILKQVPMLVYPLNPYLDQEGNAARVVYHGLGVRGNIRKSNVTDVEKNIEKVFNDDSFKARIKDFQKKCLFNNSFERGLEFIEYYLQNNFNDVVNK